MVVDQFTQLKTLMIGLDVDVIPSNAIVPFNGHQSELILLSLSSQRNLTIKSGAFQNLNLSQLEFYSIKFHFIEKGAFQFNIKSNQRLTLFFAHYENHLQGESFQAGAFDGIQRPIIIRIFNSSVNFLPESTFKSLLENQENEINFTDPDQLPQWNSKIDCNHCKNHWLIQQNKQSQVHHAYCKGNSKKTLFDDEIKENLNQKCK